MKEEKKVQGSASFCFSLDCCDNCGATGKGVAILKYKPEFNTEKDLNICDVCLKGMIVCSYNFGILD